MNKKFVIAVDGPSASGKGTLCALLSKHFNIPHLNTGGLYRATARICLDKNIDFTDEKSICEIAKNLTLDDAKALQELQVQYLNKRDIDMRNSFYLGGRNLYYYLKQMKLID